MIWRPRDFLGAAKVPKTLQAQCFGPWEIVRQEGLSGITRHMVGSDTMVSLCRFTEATLHLPHGEVVMEDSRLELSKHLPIWMAAHGRVLKTGLGLGCVVRGLLVKPEVTHVDVVEIDADIIRVIGAEFQGNPRVTIHHGDALTFTPGGRRWDFAWHDIWCPGNDGLQVLHAQLIERFWEHAPRQGAWDFPREVSRRLRTRLLGAPKTPAQRAA